MSQRFAYNGSMWNDIPRAGIRGRHRVHLYQQKSAFLVPAFQFSSRKSSIRCHAGTRMHNPWLHRSLGSSPVRGGGARADRKSGGRKLSGAGCVYRDAHPLLLPYRTRQIRNAKPVLA